MRWIEAFRESLTSRFFIGCMGLTLFLGVLVVGLAQVFDTGVTITSALYTRHMWLTLWAFIISFFFGRIVYVCLFIRPQSPIAFLARDFRDVWFTPQRIAQGLPVMMLLPVFFSLFTSAKNLIPAIHPFAWDAAFAEIERILHFGRQPWEWLHPLLGFAAATATISFIYKLWFFIKYAAYFWQAFAIARPCLRMQFFWTSFASWIINGFILATIFSSAGPCYFHVFVPGAPDPYAGLMAYLHETDKVMRVADLFSQGYLLEAYQAKRTAVFSGISAMPSMHVSVAFILMLTGWRTNRILGVLFTAYLAMVMIGSVHTGWHYAIDGYVAIITTGLLWWGIGRLTGRDDQSFAAIKSSASR